VRCRIFDANGTLVTENDRNGDDWNCAFAEPFTQGDYRLVIESETLNPGETRVSVAMATVQDTGVLVSGAALQVKDSVLVAEVPQAETGAIQELAFHGSDPFSCALEQAQGWVVDRQLNVTDCGFLLHTSDRAYRVRLWTLDRPVQVKASIAQRAIVSNDSGRAGTAEVAKATIRNAGRYAAQDDALCLPAGESGPLHSCGGSVSLSTGEWLFAAPPGKKLETDLREIPVPDDEPSTVSIPLSRAFAIQRSHSASRNVHFLRITVGPGERNIPACALDQGARSFLPDGCLAASRPSDDAVVQWWGSTDVPVEASVFRVSAPYPSRSTSLGAGHSSLSWTGPSARYALPASPNRVDVILPPQGWAVRMESNGAVGDLCAATTTMSRCILSGSGGELLLYAPSEPHAEVTLLLTTVPAATETLTSIFEVVLTQPGSRSFSIPASNDARVVRVEGAAHCLTTLVDGSRTSGCEAPLPAGQSAELTVDADAGALRASVGPPDQPELARFGVTSAATNPPAIPWSQAMPMTGSLVARSFTTDHEALVHVRADSGVCALADAHGLVSVAGFGSSCSIDRLLGPGTYRILVRPFGEIALSGSVSWTTDAVESLSDGVGPEAWIAAGQEKLYRFTTASAGHIGLGLQVPADTIDCTILDASQHVLGTGCQQFPLLDAGQYLLAIHAPAHVAPIHYRPVLVGLAGASRGVPEDYLRDFFQRIGEAP
jgi:hypothetical protein